MKNKYYVDGLFHYKRIDENTITSIFIHSNTANIRIAPIEIYLRTAIINGNVSLCTKKDYETAFKKALKIITKLKPKSWKTLIKRIPAKLLRYFGISKKAKL